MKFFHWINIIWNPHVLWNWARLAATRRCSYSCCDIPSQSDRLILWPQAEFRLNQNDDAVVIFDLFQEDDESSASELILGKWTLENAIEATAHHPPPCWARGAGQNSRGGWIRATGVSPAVRASKNEAFFSSRMDLAPAPHVQSAKVGYHAIARAGSY